MKTTFDMPQFNGSQQQGSALKSATTSVAFDIFNGATSMNPLLPSGTIPSGSSHHISNNAGGAFRKFASMTASAMGSPLAFALAALSIIVWALLGHHFKYSDTWQLVINTGTTIVTFLMVFLIQNTQNRDARAIQLKLDELIRGTTGPRNRLIDLENCEEAELAKLEAEFRKLREKHRHRAMSRAQQAAGEGGANDPRSSAG